MIARKRPARFPVFAVLDGAGGKLQRGTVTISPSGIFTARPLRRRRVYELNLSDVATMVCQRVIRAEVFARRLAKAAKKGKR